MWKVSNSDNSSKNFDISNQSQIPKDTKRTDKKVSVALFAFWKTSFDGGFIRAGWRTKCQLQCIPNKQNSEYWPLFHLTVWRIDWIRHKSLSTYLRILVYNLQEPVEDTFFNLPHAYSVGMLDDAIFQLWVWPCPSLLSPSSLSSCLREVHIQRLYWLGIQSYHTWGHS